MTDAIRLDDVSHAHAPGAEPALDSVSLSVQSGETLVLLGPSGAGKTTLLTLIDGRLHGWRGAAQVLGNNLSPDHPPVGSIRAEVGFIFQEFALIDRATVRQNVLNGRLGRTRPLAAFFGRFSEQDLDAAERAMTYAGIDDLAGRRADSLSGGQRQRVAIARCLAQEPKIILADEPVSNLDPARAADILSLISGAARSRGATVLFTSHQPDLARRFAARAVGLRDGRIVFDCPADTLTSDDTDCLYRDHSAMHDPTLRLVV